MSAPRVLLLSEDDSLHRIVDTPNPISIRAWMSLVCDSGSSSTRNFNDCKGISIMSFRTIGLLALAGLSLTAVSCSESKPGGIRLDGAGATFPAPLYKKWFEKYHVAHP